MVSRRFKKRIVYFSVFVTVILLFSVFFWWLAKPAAPPVVTEKQVAYEDITIEDVSVINHPESVDIVARLRNPNVRAGLPQVAVLFRLFNASDQEITTHTETTYMLPGAVQYVAALNIRTGGNHVSRVAVDLPQDPEFSEIPATVSMPTFSSFAQGRSIRTVGGRSLEEQRGVVENTSTFDWKRVEVMGVALDGSGDVVGVGKTFLGSLEIGEQRDFTLQWPAPPVNTDRVIILPSTNVYVEDNVIKVIGDPGSLR